MKRDNNEILKKTLKHYVDLEFYANGVDLDVQDLFSELKTKCDAYIESQKSYNTKDSYNLTYKAIKELVEEFGRKLQERMEEEAALVMQLEEEFLDNLYNKKETKKEGSVAKKVALTIGGVTLSKLLFAPIDGRDTTKQFVERTTKNILRSYDMPMRSGYLFGQSAEDIKTQAKNQLKQVSRGMGNAIKTAIPSYAKTTDKIIFINNNLEVVWVATLDGRTCIQCASLSGIHFKSAALAPSTHILCRCILIPLKDITEPIPDYEEFIESLSEEDQEQVLGKSRYEMYKNGVSLERFINNGSIKTVKELKSELSIKSELTNQDTAALVKKNYPSDTFIRRHISNKASLYVSKERIKAGIKDPLVYNSDKMMATILAKETGKDFYLLSENLVGIANPDGFYIDDTLEMKNVSGSLRKVGSNAIRALRQSQNVFVFVQKDYPIEACLNKIKGSIIDTRQQLKNAGSKFIEPSPEKRLFIYTQGKLYEKKWKDVL